MQNINTCTQWIVRDEQNGSDTYKYVKYNNALELK